MSPKSIVMCYLKGTSGDIIEKMYMGIKCIRPDNFFSRRILAGILFSPAHLSLSASTCCRNVLCLNGVGTMFARRKEIPNTIQKDSL